jgi:hypothetical protein
MSNIHDFMQVQDKFEPDCVIGEGDTEPYLISIAISMKRIADALTAKETAQEIYRDIIGENA